MKRGELLRLSVYLAAIAAAYLLAPLVLRIAFRIL